MPSIIYPMTAGYRRSWTRWDALRECVYQEFLDLFKSWTITQADGRTVVEGHGAHINLRNLLLGASDKQEEHRGRFGEGTKLGWLVLLREQIPFTLTSGDVHGLHARWADLYGEQVMEVCWEDGPFFAGSRYELAYTSELWEERVVRSVANLERRDGDELLCAAQDAGVRTAVTRFPLEAAGEALHRLREGALEGAAVLVMDPRTPTASR